MITKPMAWCDRQRTLVWFYLTEKNPRLSVLSLTDGADVSSLAALTPSGCCACMLRTKKKKTPQHSWLLILNII